MRGGAAAARPGSGGEVLDLGARERSRDFTARLGMAVFLGSWAMLFAALFFACGILRARAEAWPPPGEPRLPLLLPGVATAVLAASSALVAAAARRARAGLRPAAARALASGAALGAAFLALQALVWAALWRGGLRPGSAFASVFYGLTAIHAAHVLVGLAGLAAVAAAGRGRPGWPLRVRLWGHYWHFVAAVWAILFAAVYVT